MYDKNVPSLCFVVGIGCLITTFIKLENCRNLNKNFVNEGARGKKFFFFFFCFRLYIYHSERSIGIIVVRP